MVTRIVAHSRRVLDIALNHGWRPGARYTNLRDVRHLDHLWFLDIDWKRYSFPQHLAAARSIRPTLTVAQDIERLEDLPRIIDQAHELQRYVETVVVVPKDPRLGPLLKHVIPSGFRLGYSVPTRYGSSTIPVARFAGREVHLLGGRPDVQRRLARLLNVVSLDCNRFTLDASFGDYFDGERFRPHPIGGYDRCIRDSVKRINQLWADYEVRERGELWNNRKLGA